MPVYQYQCDRCGGVIEDQRPMAERRTPLVCPDPKCEGVAYLTVSLPAGTFPGADHWRTRQKAVR